MNEKEILDKMFDEIQKEWIQVLEELRSIKDLEEARNKKKDGKEIITFLIICEIASIAVLTTYFYFSNIELLTIIKAFLVFWLGWGTGDFLVYKYTSKEYRLLATPDLLELEKNKEVLEKKERELSTKSCTLSAETKKLENKLRNIEVVETFYNSIEENKFKLKKEKNIIKCDQILNNFLNERIDYANIELEVNYYNEDKYKNHNKTLKKNLNRN